MQLARDIRREAMTRLEEAARTEDDFKAVVAMWDHLDRNRQRKERRHEIGRSNEDMLHWDKPNENDVRGKLRERLDTIIPPPLVNMWWRQHIRGAFLDEIYDNPEDMWQHVGDRGIARPIKDLTAKQKEVLFLSAVRLCTPQQIACYQGKTDRAVRKLLAAALESIRDDLAYTVRAQICAKSRAVTFAKRQFLNWYEEREVEEAKEMLEMAEEIAGKITAEKITLDSSVDKE